MHRSRAFAALIVVGRYMNFWRRSETPIAILWLGLWAASLAKGAALFSPNDDLGHPSLGGLSLSSRGLTRRNSIRDTVQAQHKHIPNQSDAHHSCNSEPQNSPSFVVTFKLLGVHGFRFKKLTAVAPRGVVLWGLSGVRGHEAKAEMQKGESSSGIEQLRSDLSTSLFMRNLAMCFDRQHG
jgi:hypothetical protein